ncbi:putative defense protein [Ostrea edulis]|uniref:putative defense protein n=1 Tax=Ostrea edulis TaxID=37623 RepID=UPI0024AF9FF9|nr:putative defense protein [Ostrea edulis]
MMLYLTYVVLVFLPGVISYAYGPPLGSCASMFPTGHKASAQTTAPPYTISVNATSYSPNDVIEITVNTTGLHGVTYYEGIMMQARQIACDVAAPTKGHGSFSVEEGDQFLETMDCEDNAKSAVVHMNHSKIESRVFHWKASFPSGVGHLIFRATIVKSKTTFWTKVYSSIIEDESSQAPLKICSNGSNTVEYHSMITVMFALTMLSTLML